ncbi:MAG: T9SS type A sorting domain-containing protein [Hyphomicrobiales bacterium]
MKKTLLSLLMICSIIITNTTFAQNSENNTILTDTNPLAGGYIIDHEGGGDFKTIQEAVTKLNDDGVSAAVVFTIKVGTYKENLHIKNITGASATNTITFKLDEGIKYGADLKSMPSADVNYTLYLDNAQFITFKNMTFLPTESRTSRLIEIGNGTTNITFKDCEFFGNPVTKADPNKDNALIFSDNSQCENGLSNIKFETNKFENGSYGIVFNDVSSCQEYNEGINITENTFKKHSEGAILLQYQNIATINSNLFFSEEASGNYQAISLKDVKGNSEISFNTIFAVSEATEGMLEGIKVDNFHTEGKLSIYNNMSSTIAKAKARSMYIKNVNNALIAHNNLFSIGEKNSSCLQLSADNTLNIYKNNILQSEGAAHCMVLETEAPADMVSDYNVMYNTNNSVVLKLEADKNYETLAAWSTDSKLDENSKDIDPKYCSTKDLHILNAELKFCPKLDEVTNDIDLQDRADEKTYAGADETIGETVPVEYIVYKDDTDVPERIILNDGAEVDLVQKYSLSLPILIKNSNSVNPSRVTCTVTGDFLLEEEYKHTVIGAKSSIIITMFPKKYSVHSTAVVTFTQENGATTSFTLKCKIIPPMGVEENTKEKPVVVYPNPSSGNLNIQFKSNVEASIIDLTGNTIKEYSNINSNTIKSEVLEQGIYFLKVIEEGKTYIEKIIVK